MRLACDAAVVRRALVFSAVVGFVLIAINHGDAILAGDIGARKWLKMGLTVLVPYAVSTLSSVMAMRAMRGS
ncbi:MAG: nitrate/nitrite transporter NrtS [Myxococcales bacterium]|nr:nitrate/nitrite transporter NrtS [Myxococcales bacterium]